MPKLPSIETMGRRPTPKPSTYVPGRHGFETAKADALRDLGSSVQEFGRTFDRVQDEHDKTRAEDAYNQLLNRKMDLTSGDDGFKQKKSGDAANSNLMVDYGGRLDSAIDEAGDKLDTPRQRKYYRDRANIAALQYKQDMLNHVTREQEVYQTEVFGATLKTEARNVASKWNDPRAVDVSLSRINGVIDQEGDRKGWPKEKVDQAKFMSNSGVHTSIIQQAINNKDPMYAREWFDANKKDIDPDVYDDIDRLIKNADLTELVQDVADESQLQGLSEFEALAEARKKYSGIEEEEIKKGIKARYSETQSAAAEQAWDVYQDTGDLNRVISNVNLWDSLSGQEKVRLKAQDKAAKEGGTKTGGGDYYKIRQIMQRDPLAFDRLELDRYTLAPGDRKELMKAQTDPAEMDDAQSKAKIINQTLATLGVDPKDLDDPGSGGDRARLIEQRINAEIRQASAAKGDKKLSMGEIRDISDRAQIEVLRERSLTPWGEYPWRLFGDIEARAGTMEIEGIPTEEIDELAATIQRYGQPVTEATIKALYNAIQRERAPPLLRKPR